MSTNSNKVSKWDAIWRGYRKRCPHCDSAPLFPVYLKPVERCTNCGENYGHICADDLPAYLTILVVGHIIVPFFMLTDRLYNLSGWVHGSIWPPLAMVLMFYLLPRLKGVAVAWMWRIGLTGDETQGPRPGNRKINF